MEKYVETIATDLIRLRISMYVFLYSECYMYFFFLIWNGLENFTTLNNLIIPGFKNKSFVKSIAMQKHFDNVVCPFFPLKTLVSS